MRMLLAAIVTAVLLSASAAPASADRSRPVVSGCHSGGWLDACVTVHDAGGLSAVAIDGRTAYGAARASGALVIFDRDPATGRLTQRGCVTATGGGGCAAARGLAEPTDVALSPDGRHVYVAGFSGTIAIFERSAAGGVQQRPGADGCLVDIEATAVQGCRQARRLSEAESLVFSPDGRHLYVGGESLAVLDRDAATGALTQRGGVDGCFEDGGKDGCTHAPALSDARQLAIAPDGRSLYVPSKEYGGLLSFRREAADGRLSFTSCQSVSGKVKDGVAMCAVEPRLSGASGTLVSGDGRHVYVSTAAGVLTYARDASGGLALQACAGDAASCASGRALAGREYSGLSPDGTLLVTSGAGGIAVLERDPASGVLVQPPGVDGCLTPTGSEGCGVLAQAAASGHVRFAGDESFYVGAQARSTLTAFKRDYYPTCAPVSVTVASDAIASLPLACSDRNGDPLTYEFTSASGGGRLGAVDHGAGSVLYSPLDGFSGVDAFRYRGVAAGLASADADVTVAVTAAVPAVIAAIPAPPAPPPSQPPSTTTTKVRSVTSPVRYHWRLPNRRPTVTRLSVRQLPARATIQIVCSGKPRCPFKTKRTKRGARSTRNLLPVLGKHRAFRAGQTIDVRISAPDRHTKVVRFKLNSRAAPEGLVRCIRLGSTRVRSSC